MKKYILTLFACMLSALSFADGIIPLQMGEVFTIKNNGTDVWSITPTESGVMKIVGENGDGDWIGSCLDVYDNAAMTQPVQSYNWTCYEVTVTAGHTYYIKTWNFSGSDFRGKCVMAGQFGFTGSEPAAGSSFHIIGDCELYLHFTDSNVSFKEGELSCNGNVVKIYNFTDFNDLVASGIFTYTQVGTSGVVNYNGCVLGHTDINGIVIPFITQTGYEHINVLYEMLSSGKIATGQTMTLNLHGVKSDMTGTLLGGNGELELEWLVGEMPTTLQSYQLPSCFLSYWTPGDKDGYAEFTFSRTLKSAQARIAMGQADAGDRYEADVPVIIDGNKAVIDFTGERRDADIMGLSKLYSTMEVMLFNVKDINGNPTYSGKQGTASSYSYTIAFRDVSGEVSYEITPSSGQTLTADDKEIEIWYNDPNNLIEADGVSVSYYSSEGELVSIVYTRADLSWTESAGATTILVPVTDAMRTSKDVCVRLDITKSHDGRDHAIVAYYNTALSHEWEIGHMADPVDGTTLHRLSEIYFTLNSTYAINTAVNKPHAVVTDASGTQVTTATFERNGKTNAMLVLGKPIMDAGVYTVTIADGVIGDYVFGDSGYKSGTCNPLTRLEYIVTGEYAGRSMVTDPAEGTVEYLGTIRLISFDWSAIAPSWNVEAMPYVERADGSQVLAIPSEDGDEAANVVTLNLEKTIGEVGTYTLVVPSGAISNALTDDPIETEFRFTYNIVIPVGISTLPHATVSPAYNLNGQLLRQGMRGVVIQQGKKVMVTE